MDWKTFFTILGFLVSLVVAVLTIVKMVKGAINDSKLEMGKEISELGVKVEKCESDFEKKMTSHSEESEKKFGSVYRRFDELKDFAERRYLSKELANVMHEATAKNIGALEKKFDDMRIEVRGELSEVKKGQQDLIIAIQTQKGR